jgi:hypothetical protein
MDTIYFNKHVHDIDKGGQRTSYIRVFFTENFIMAKIFQPSDKIKLIFILFHSEIKSIIYFWTQFAG